MNRRSTRKDEEQNRRRLEAVAAVIGAVLAIGTFGVIVYEGVTSSDRPPLVELRAERVQAFEGGFLVEVAIRNAGDRAAADLTIEGLLNRGGSTVETSEMLLDYLPSSSSRRGGLYFRNDPADYELVLRASGYREP